MKKIINENERGFLFDNGRFIKMLMPGKYQFFKTGKKIEVFNLSFEFKPVGYDIEIFLKDSNVKNQLMTVNVPDEAIALHYVNGRFQGCLASGRYAFWTVYDKHEFQQISIKNPEVSEEIPRYLFSLLPLSFYTKVEVAQNQKARLYFDQKFIRLLDEGTYYFWNNGTKINAGYADTRLLQMDITGQEILTLDKVTLRINLVCHYKITDYIKIHTEINNYEEQIHVMLQLALREYIGKNRLDDILENKEQLSVYVFEKLKEKETQYYIKAVDAGVKDIILPGEIRDIMNTVLIAEKRAQANVITRREEVASTRSLLNTAKLMEENQTLYKLKELEYVEKICEKVGTITVNGSADLLSQLTAVLKGDKPCSK